MKKIVISLLLVFTVLFAGCSCNQAPNLTFSDNWNQGSEQGIGYSETQTYAVSFNDNYASGGYSFVKSSEITSELATYEFTNGSYTTNLSVVAKDASVPNVDSDVLKDYTLGLYKYTTEFRITAKYSCAPDKVYDDYITTVTYFCTSNASYAPIYTKTENKSSILHVNNGVASVKESHSLTDISYQKATYTIKEYNPQTKEVTKSTDYNYSFKTAIDNNQLLFAIRNSTVPEKSALTLPTVVPTYGSLKNIQVAQYQENLSENVTVNGSTANMEMQCLSFVLSGSSSSCIGNGTTNTGRAQLLFVQAKENDVLAKRSQIIRYVTPLTTYDSFNLMGALVFDLTSYTVG